MAFNSGIHSVAEKGRQSPNKDIRTADAGRRTQIVESPVIGIIAGDIMGIGNAETQGSAGTVGPTDVRGEILRCCRTIESGRIWIALAAHWYSAIGEIQGR